MNKQVLDNGLQIVFDNRPESDFLTLAYMINKGCYDEPLDKLGIAHLVEHLVFKGTANRDKEAIWDDIQIVGGTMNAFTADTHTVFYASALAEHADVIFDVISDIVWNNSIPEEEFDLEKSVVIEELKMYQDDGRTRMYELMSKSIYPSYKTRWSNGGTPESVGKLTRQDVIDFISNNYIPKNITLFVTGNIGDEQKFVDKINKYLMDYDFVDSSIEYRQQIENVVIDNVEENMEGTNQSHLVVYTPIVIENLKDYLCASMMCNVLGGGFGSRLMMIREQYGYAYAVSCDFNYTPTEEAMMMIYVGLNIDNVSETRKIIDTQIVQFVKDGIKQKEFEQAYNSLLTSIKKDQILNSDATMSYITRTANQTDIETDEVVKELEQITIDDVNEFIDVNIDIENFGSALIKQTC